MKLTRLKRPKAAYFPSYANCRLTNAVILWDMGHTKQRACKGAIGQGRETKNLNEVDVLMV
jgi:hypothetical protein